MRAGVLLVRAGALGDILLLRRAVAGLRAAGRRVALLAPGGPGSVLLGSGPAEVERLIAWDRADAAALLTGEGLGEGPLREELAAFEAALAYTRNAALQRSLSRLIPHALAHDPLPPPKSGHASVYLASPLAALGVAPALGPLPVLAPSPAEVEAARALLDRLPGGFLAIHPGSGAPRKNWPAERFRALVEAASPGRPWLLVEGPADAGTTRVLEAVPGAVLARALSPRVLGAVLACAGAYVGNDSGVSHLAAAFGAPAVALFGPTDPEVWAPVGPGVRVVRSPSGRMEEIGIEAVLDALAVLRSSEPGRPSG